MTYIPLGYGLPQDTFADKLGLQDCEQEGEEMSWNNITVYAQHNLLPAQYDDNNIPIPWNPQWRAADAMVPFQASFNDTLQVVPALQSDVFPLESAASQTYEPPPVPTYDTMHNPIHSQILRGEEAREKELGSSEYPNLHPLQHSNSSSSSLSSNDSALGLGNRHDSFSSTQSSEKDPSIYPTAIKSSSSSTTSSSPSKNSPLPQDSPPNLSLTTTGTKRKRTRTLSPQARQETKVTRAMGACNICRLKKKRCIRVATGCCTRCVAEEIVPSPHARSSLPDSQLFRLGPTEEFLWTRRRWLDVTFDNADVWIPNVPSIRVSISQAPNLVPLEIDLKMFNRQPEDKDTYTWTNSLTQQRGSWTLPHYAVADVAQAKESIQRYFNDNLETFIEQHIGPQETIPYRTFQLALRMSRSEHSDLLRNTLRLWSASRVLETPFSITQNFSALGLAPQNEPGSPYHQKVPVTPCMDWQIDNIAITRLLKPLRKEILRDLKAKVFTQSTKRSGKALVDLEIYLCLFILLHNIELTTAHDRWFAQRWGVKTRFSNYELINKTFEAANVMLTHFHKVNKGFLLFAQDWDDLEEGQSLTRDLSPEKREYLQIVSREVERQACGLKLLKEKKLYEERMFWCSQLFYDGWTHVVSPCA